MNKRQSEKAGADYHSRRGKRIPSPLTHAELKALLLEQAEAIRLGEADRTGGERDANAEAVHRIITREEALSAWRDLSKKPTIRHARSRFTDIVDDIISQVALNYSPASMMRTPGQTRKAALKAAKLAKQLAQLINENYQLEGAGSAETASLAEKLLRFADGVNDTARYPSIAPQPNHRLAHEQAFASELCQTVNYYYGKPYIAVVAAFTSAVFDVRVDGETVKKMVAATPKFERQK